jgi:hypothetical protein
MNVVVYAQEQGAGNEENNAQPYENTKSTSLSRGEHSSSLLMNVLAGLVWEGMGWNG